MCVCVYTNFTDISSTLYYVIHAYDIFYNICMYLFGLVCTCFEENNQHNIVFNLVTINTIQSSHHAA